jgi:hypothetical protein
MNHVDYHSDSHSNRQIINIYVQVNLIFCLIYGVIALLHLFPLTSVNQRKKIEEYIYEYHSPLSCTCPVYSLFFFSLSLSLSKTSYDCVPCSYERKDVYVTSANIIYGYWTRGTSTEVTHCDHNFFNVPFVKRRNWRRQMYALSQQHCDSSGYGQRRGQLPSYCLAVALRLLGIWIEKGAAAKLLSSSSIHPTRGMFQHGDYGT